ncbi:MAG: putative motility protein [Lachnospiraceae bacterium]|nr:putative motility protein [Lachnospiraceae bacterium]
MDLTMSIAAASMDLSAAKVQQDVSISLLKKAMQSQEESLNVIMDGVDAAMAPPVEHKIDVYA